MTEVNTDTNASSPELRSPEPPPLGMGDQLHYQRYQQKHNKVLWGIFTLLIVLTGGVFFVLPRFVGPVAAPTAAVVVATQNSSAAASVAISPFEEAQKMRQREAAQNTLAALLALQDTLEKKQVLEWAADDFNAGIASANSGDEAYRQQQFNDANDKYKAGLDMLQRISDSEPRVYDSAIAAGIAAITAGDADAAEKAYGQALLINPDSSDAVAGLERAGVLNKVLELLQNGRDLQAGNQLEAALEQYTQAQGLDNAHAAVKAAIVDVNKAIADRNFATVMSRGYAALQADHPDEAISAFEQALKLRPGSTDVQAALQQAHDRATFVAVSVHITAAQAAEAAETWALALSEWQAALGVDPNLVSALEGSRRSDSRNNLDKFLESIIATPLRVAEASVYDQTSSVLADAKRIPNPGPRLQGQLQQVGGFLERAKIPVSVQLQSDGMTTVTVYKVAELGLFSSQTLTLTPGTYTAVGVRAGYRDVRKEFVVTLDGQAPLVTVACSESI